MKLFGVTLLVASMLLFMVNSLSAQANSQGSKLVLYETAKQELLEILNKMPNGNESAYGFNDRSEFSRAELGIPYQEYSLPYNNFSQGTSKPTGYWRIPVTIDGENRAMLRYALEDGEWKWKGFGAAGLASELGQLEKSQSIKPKSGKILRDYNFTCDYIQFDAISEYVINGELIPLKAAKSFLESIENQIKTKYNISEIEKLRLYREPE